MNHVGCRMKYSTKKSCPFSWSSYELERQAPPSALSISFSLSLFHVASPLAFSLNPVTPVGKLTTNSERKDLQRVNLDFNEACLKRPFRSSPLNGTSPSDKRPAPSNCCGLGRVRGWKIVLLVSSFLPLSLLHLREQVPVAWILQNVSLFIDVFALKGCYWFLLGYWRLFQDYRSSVYLKGGCYFCF